MRFYLDTQHDSPGGEMISLALVREDGRSLYVVLPHDVHSELPGAVAVMAVLKNTPESPVRPRSREIAAAGIDEFLDAGAVVVGTMGSLEALCALLMLAGGCPDIEPITRPETTPKIPRNAWHEAVALRDYMDGLAHD